MQRHIANVTLVVRDYDEAIAYYTSVLGFTLMEDTILEETNSLGGVKRWVLVAPSAASLGEKATSAEGGRRAEAVGSCLLLAQGVGAEQESRIGNQTGGRVFLFLHTDDFWRDYRTFLSRGVKFTKPPWEAPYGTAAVFEDLYGNRWDLIQPKDISMS